MYEDYYADQSGGGGVPYYAGAAGQRGHGLGSMLSGLFRSAMPMIKRGLAFFGRHALKTGMEVANDVVEGQSFGAAARRRVPEGINRLVSSAGFNTQSGSGGRRRKRRARSTGSEARVKRRKRSKSKSKSNKNKKKKKKKKGKSGIADDIFS